MKSSMVILYVSLEVRKYNYRFWVRLICMSAPLLQGKIKTVNLNEVYMTIEWAYVSLTKSLTKLNNMIM